MTAVQVILILFAVVVSATLVCLVWLIHKLRTLSESVDNVIEEVEEDDLGGEELVRRLEEIRGELS